MAERKSPVVAIINKDGAQEYQTADGLPLDLGGSAKLYQHVIMLSGARPIELAVLSTRKTAFTTISDLGFSDDLEKCAPVAFLYGIYDTIYPIISIGTAVSNKSCKIVVYSSNDRIIEIDLLGVTDIARDTVYEWLG